MASYSTIYTEFRSTWDDIASDSIKEFVVSTQYQGFDPLLVMDTLKGLKMVKEDLAMMIALFAERGNSIDSMLKKSSAVGQELIKKLSKKYALVSKTKNPKDISLARVAIAFCWLSVEYSMSHQVSRTVPIDHLSIDGVVCPLAVMTPAFGSLIPRGMKYTAQLVDIFTNYQARLSMVLAGEKAGTFDESWVKSEKYVSAAVNSANPSQDMRKSWLAKYEIVDERGNLVGEWNDYYIAVLKIKPKKST